MSFTEKLKRAFQKNKGRLIVFFLFSIVMLFVLVAPLSIMYGNGVISAQNQNKAAIGTNILKFDFSIFYQRKYATKICKNCTSNYFNLSKICIKLLLCGENNDIILLR